MKHLSSNKIIQIKNLDVSVGGGQILHNITFDVHKGDIVTIVGPNGAGKSTLIKAMLGLISYSGTIIYTPTESGAQPEIGYVPQRLSVDKSFPLTVREFLHLPKKHQNKSFFQKIIREVGIVNILHSQIGKISGGELQRVLIARALLIDPDILFMDEPTAGIDIQGNQTFYELLVRINKKYNTTIITVTHEMGVVHSFSDFVLCINREMCCHGEPQDVLHAKTYKKMFGETFNALKNDE